MLFQFAPEVQKLIDSGVYEIVRNTAGELVGIARDKATGQFVAHAIRATPKVIKLALNLTLDPLIAAPQMVMGGVQMIQTHRGFQKVYGMLDAGFEEVNQKLNIINTGLQSLQASMVVLQATTAFIGVGVVAGVALSGVNLHQTLKLREDVKHLRLEVKDGFIDLKKALKDQGEEIIRQIDIVAQDIKFEQHRTILKRAYEFFIQALHRLRFAMQLQDINRRNAEIDATRGMLFDALRDYTNSDLLAETCAAGQLRRLECAWAIEQTIVLTYQIQNEFAAVSDCLSHLQTKIRQDTLNIINSCETEDEIDFLFPEITRIHDHDLAVLNSWQNHVDWMRSLSPEDAKLLHSSDFSNSEFIDSLGNNQTTTALAAPPEQLLYENLKQKSHPKSLELQLKFMMLPELRLKHETYISQQAASTGYKALVSSNLQQASDLAVANLYWYFKIRDQQQVAA